MNKQIKIGAMYGRVSVDEAAAVEHGSLEQQRHMADEYAKGMSLRGDFDYKITHYLIEERGVSGKNTNRPKYQELISLIESQKIDFVIAKEISRISRSTKDFCDFISLCKHNKVAVHFRNMDADPNTPMGEMIFKIFAMIAEFERQQIVERTKSSIRSAQKNNSKINGGPPPLGFYRDPNRKGFYLVDDEKMSQVFYLMEYFNKTLSMEETTKESVRKGFKNTNGNNFNKNSIRRLLTNTKYIGKMKLTRDGCDSSDDEYVDLDYGCPIPLELFKTVQFNLANTRKKGKNSNRIQKRAYPLSGLLFFEDDTPFEATSGTGRNKSYFYYRNTKNKVTVNAEDIEKAVIKALRIYENDSEMIKYANEIQKTTYSHLKTLENQFVRITNQLKLLEKKEDQLGDKLIDSTSENILAFVEKQLSKITTEKDSLILKKIELDKEIKNLSSQKIVANDLKKSLKVVFDKLACSELSVQKGIFRKIFSKVEVFRDNTIRIHWSYKSLCNFEKGGVTLAPPCEEKSVKSLEKGDVKIFGRNGGPEGRFFAPRAVWGG